MLALVALGVLGAAGGAGAEETFDIAAYEKKAFEWSGFLEARPERQWLRPGSAGYLLQYPGQARRTADRAAGAAELAGVLRHRSLSFHVTGHASWLDEPRGSDDDSRLYEAYAGWQIDPRSNVEVGKCALRWGKGYAWSPVALLERPKDPTDPELAREGFRMVTASWVRSFDGALQTLAVTGAVVPTTGGLNPDFGGGGHVNPALKLYALVHDTDVDLVWSGRGSHGPRFGVDFSRNLGSNWEVHGEWARMADVPRSVLSSANTVRLETRSHSSALVGLRYLSQQDTTVILEWYRNGGGYGSDELAAYYDLVKASALNPGVFPAALRIATQGYVRPNAGRHYTYLRVSQKEPFGILYFTPSVSVIANVGDRSWTVIPEVLYTGIKNLELRARVQVNGGGAGTEFGEKGVRSRFELRGRYFF